MTYPKVMDAQSTAMVTTKANLKTANNMAPEDSLKKAACTKEPS